MPQVDRAKHLYALSKQARDEGCYVEAAWLKFYAKAPGDLPPVGHDFSRLMFFAGATAIFDTMKTLAQCDQLSRSDLDFLHSIDEELTGHSNHQMLSGDTKGSA